MPRDSKALVVERLKLERLNMLEQIKRLEEQVQHIDDEIHYLESET